MRVWPWSETGGRGECVLDRAPDGNARSRERRFATALERFKLTSLSGLSKRLEIEDRRQVADVGDFVGGGRVRQEGAGVVVLEFLHRAPAHALNKAAEDLPAVDAGLIGMPMSMSMSTRVTRSSPVKRSISTSPRPRRSECSTGTAVPLPVSRVQVHAGRGVEPSLAERDAFEVGALNQLGKRHAAIRSTLIPNVALGKTHVRRRRGESARSIRQQAWRGEVGESGFDPASRVERGGPVQVRAADAAVGEVLLFSSVLVVVTRTERVGDAQVVSDELADARVDTLAHFGATVADLHGPVG